jgi:G3E family GTPase
MTHPVMQICPGSVSVPQCGIPVTIVAGFWDSSKTTLLNHILNNRQDLKVAVIVNVIGRDLNAEAIKAQLIECIAI